MAYTYDLGDVARVGNSSEATEAAAFASLAGAATDPTSVTLTVERPDGTLTVYAWPTPGAGESTLTRQATGRFYADITLDQEGLWSYRLVGTGAVAAAAEKRFIVRARWT